MDPHLDNARSYVALVKMTLGPGTPQYTNFLTILKGYRTGEIAVYDVIDQISNLFRGDSELILGFNTFLPEDYHIKLPSDDEPGGTDAEEEYSNEENNKKLPTKKKEARIPNNVVIVSTKRRRIVHEIPKNRVTSSTRVLLSPLTSKRQPTDLLYDYDPLADETFISYPPQHDVVCKVCNGATDSIATSKNDNVVLLCDQKGCNAEYHLRCLPSSLVSKKNNGERDVPEGDIYCKKCAEDGATTVLEKYFDRVDYARSHYSCSRAYVIALLENQMRANPEGNLLRGEKNGVGDLSCPPRSELWSAFEVNNNLTLNDKDDGKTEKNLTSSSAGASFLVGKPIRLYNNLDNEYHVGRIVDWRSCSAYPDYSANDPSASDDNTVHINDLEYFGTGVISSCEFLVRFPAGVNGRRKDLLKWIVLEEHSLAVGIRLIEGKSSKTWAPAMVLARTSLELVPVRKHLHEDDSGELFAKLNDKPAKSGSGKQCWALASFFGQETHALLDLNNEARDLMSNCGSDEDRGSDEQPGNTGSILRHPLNSVSVSLALALAERDEQQRCVEWNNKLLHDSKHPLVLVASDEYSSQLRNEGKASLPIELGIDRMWLATLANKQNQTFYENKDALMSVKYQPVASISNAMALLQSRR